MKDRNVFEKYKNNKTDEVDEFDENKKICI